VIPEAPFELSDDALDRVARLFLDALEDASDVGERQDDPGEPVESTSLAETA
jgi:hypothetical protein